NINRALELAYDELVPSSESPDRQKAVVLLTDGHPELAIPWTIEDQQVEGRTVPGKQSYYRRHFELVEQYRQADIKIFTIAMGEYGRGKDPDLEELDLPVDPEGFRDLWVHAADQTEGRYYWIHGSGDLFTVYHDIAAMIMGASSIEIISNTHEGTGPTTERFDVPNCRQMAVSVEKGGHTEVSLIDPDGLTQSPSREEAIYKIYDIQDPKKGKWTIRFIGGRSRYTVRLDCLRTGIKLTCGAVRSMFPQGKPMPLEVRVTDDDGAPIPNAWTGVMITFPDGNQETVSLSSAPARPGVYEGLWKNTEQEGLHHLKFQATQEERTAVTEHNVSLEPILYLDLREPQEGHSYSEVVVKAGLKRGLELQGGLAVGPAAPTIQATLLDEGGHEVASLPLEDTGNDPDEEQGDGIYSARFHDIPEGEYTAVLTLDAPAEGTTDQVSVHFWVVPPEVPKLLFELPADWGQVRVGETVRVPMSVDASQVRELLVVDIQLEGGQPALRLQTATMSIPAGKPNFRGELEVAVSDDAGPKPGGSLPVYTGKLNFTTRDGHTLHSAPFRIEVLPPPVRLSDSDLGRVHVGETFKARVKYDTSGLPTAETIKVTLDGVPAGLFGIEEPSDNVLTLSPGKQGEAEITIRANEAAAPPEGRPAKDYSGRFIFAYEDGSIEECPFSVRVLPPPFPWGIVLGTLGAVAAVIGSVWIFYKEDPLSLFCRLEGELIYLEPTGRPNFLLTGRKTTLSLAVATSTGEPTTREKPPEEESRGDYYGYEEGELAGYRGVSTVMLTFRAQKPRAPRPRAPKLALPLLDITEAPESVGVDVDGMPRRRGDRDINLKHDSEIAVDGYRLQYKHPKGDWLPPEPELSLPLDEEYGYETGDEEYDIGLGGDEYDDYGTHGYDEYDDYSSDY
ncbi:MAG: choice-of-anchor X domain-containing protein, partial [Anaerolineae bacterium]